MKRRGHWNAVYTTKGERDVSWFEALPDLSLEMMEPAGLSEQTCVLDVGGGDSRLVDALADPRARVSGRARHLGHRAQERLVQVRRRYSGPGSPASTGTHVLRLLRLDEPSSDPSLALGSQLENRDPGCVTRHLGRRACRAPRQGRCRATAEGRGIG